MAEGKENLCFVQSLGSLFLELTQVPTQFDALKKLLFRGLSEVS